MASRLRGLMGMTLIVMAPAALAGQEVHKVEQPVFVAMKHLEGTLALNRDSIVSVFYTSAEGDKPTRLRINLPGGDNKTVEANEADELIESLRAGGHGAFLWVSHMGGRLGIPLASIQSVYTTGTGEARRLRINYPGDPQGKTVEGSEAEAVWRTLMR